MTDNVSAILLDMDGVLVDFFGGFRKAHGIDVDPFTLGNMGRYDIYNFFGPPPEKFWEPCRSHHFWAELSWTLDGRAILATAEAAVGAENVYLLSNPLFGRKHDGSGDESLGVYAYSGKAAWVRKNAPKYAGRLLLGACKHLCCNPRHLLIDDCDRYVDEFKSGGGQAILVPRYCNREYANAHAAHGVVWQQLQERL